MLVGTPVGCGVGRRVGTGVASSRRRSFTRNGGNAATTAAPEDPAPPTRTAVASEMPTQQLQRRFRAAKSVPRAEPTAPPSAEEASPTAAAADRAKASTSAGDARPNADGLATRSKPTVATTSSRLRGDPAAATRRRALTTFKLCRNVPGTAAAAMVPGCAAANTSARLARTAASDTSPSCCAVRVSDTSTVTAALLLAVVANTWLSSVTVDALELRPRRLPTKTKNKATGHR